MMNISMRLKWLGRVMPLALLLLSSLAWGQVIDLTVEDNGESKSLQTRSNHCPDKPGAMGCIKVAKGSAATIKFVLPAAEKCGSGAVKGHWQISGVQLAMNNKAWNNPGLTEKAASDFNADANNGWVQGVRPGTTVSISNENTGIYDVWYRVQASCTVSGESSIDLDPKITNTGR
jgi:hypothetical protein